MEQQLLNLNEQQLYQFATALAGKPVSIADKIQNGRAIEYICQNRPEYRNICSDLNQRLWREDIGGKEENNLSYLYQLSQLTQDDRMLLASQSNQDKLLLWSLARGADIHYQHDRALIDASKNGFTNIVQILLSRGADVHTNNDLPIIVASENGHNDVVKLLIKNDADVIAQNNRALRLAANNGHKETVAILVGAGAFIELLTSKQRKEYLP